MRITTSSRLMRVMSTCNGQRSDSCRGDGYSGITADTALGWLGGRVVSELDSGAQGPGFKSQPRRCRVTVLGKLFTPTAPLFTKQRNW